MEHLFSFNKPGLHYVEDTVIYDYGFYYNTHSGLTSVGVQYSYPAYGINYEWSCNNNWQLVYGGTDYAEFEGPLTGSILEVKLCFDNPCGARTCLIRELYLPEDSYSLVFSPNPVSNETTVSIEPSAGAKSFDENAEWDLEVYGANQNLQEKKPKQKGSSATLQTAGWKEGVYLVRAVYKDEILTGKLVVKR